VRLLGRLFVRGSLIVKDFSPRQYHGFFSFRDSLGENAFVGLQNGGSVQSPPIGAIQAREMPYSQLNSKSKGRERGMTSCLTPQDILV